MMSIVLVATDSVEEEPSKQLTIVPFRLLLTGTIIILDISGKVSGSESLGAVKVELLIITTGDTLLLPMDERTFIMEVIV